MGAITISDNQRIEYKDLEAHVNISHERYRILEERIARAEREVEKIHEENKANRRIVVGTTISLLTGIILLFAPRLVELLIKGQ
jgi:hypothetical protein